MRKISLYLAMACAFLLSACSAMKPTPYDYTNYLESKPQSILVLLPTDTTNDVKGSPAVLAQAISPLAENGYYVFPPALVYQTFKHLPFGCNCQPTQVGGDVFGRLRICFVLCLCQLA